MITASNITESKILPLLAEFEYQNKFTISPDLLGAYINGNSIAVLFDSWESGDKSEIEEDIATYNTAEPWTKNDKTHVLYNLAIPEKYKADIKQIIDGYQSTISTSAQNRIKEFWGSGLSTTLTTSLHDYLYRLGATIDVTSKQKTELTDAEFLEPSDELINDKSITIKI